MPQKKKKEISICLTMIVKNEKNVIYRCFDSVLPYIDYWVIHDTGSTDNTPEMIENYFKKHQIPGKLYHTPFLHFGHNRSLAVASARNKADYLILMDADFIFKIKDPDFKKKNLTADAYMIRYEGPLDYRQNLFVSGKYPWKYIGVTHEYIHCPEAKRMEPGDFFMFHHPGDGGCRADKFQRDIRLLTEGLKEEPKNVRYMFYLAQSHKDIKQFDQAIVWYQKRVDIGGWPEEVYYSLYQLGMCKMRRGDEFYCFMGDLIKAFMFRPVRLEALFNLIRYCRMRKELAILGYQLGKMAINAEYPKDLLFVEKPIHDYLFLDELSICAHNNGKFKRACQISQRILDESKFPESERPRLEKNLRSFKNKYREYLQSIKGKDIKALKRQPRWKVMDRAELAKAQAEARSRQPQSTTKSVVTPANLPEISGIPNTNVNTNTNVNAVAQSKEPVPFQQKQQFKISLNQLQQGTNHQRFLQRNSYKLKHPVAGQPHILLIGNFVSFFMNKVDLNRVNFFHYLSEADNNIQIHGFGLTYQNSKLPVEYLIRQVYGQNSNATTTSIKPSKPDMIMYYLMGTTDFYQGICTVGLEYCAIPKLIWIEDIHYPNVYHQQLNELGFHGVLLGYRHNEYAKLYQTLVPGITVHQIEQFIDISVFKPAPKSSQKEYDILLYGYHDPKFYRLRDRMFKLLKHQQKYRLKYLEHPGYNNIKTMTGQGITINQDLAKLIQKSYLTVCTDSNFHLFLKKYMETGSSGSIICGSLPPEYQDFKKDVYLLEINENMTDQEILKIIDKALENRSELVKKALKQVPYFHKRFSYETGYQNWSKAINEFYQNHQKKSQKTLKKINQRDEDIPVIRSVTIPAKRKTTIAKTLLIEWYQSDNPDRQKEYYQVLEKNLALSEIEKIIIFIEERYSILKKELEDRYANSKIRLVSTKRRLTFRDCFRYINDNLPQNRIAIVANADIYFDQTISSTDQISQTNRCLALMRHDIKDPKGSPVLFNNNGGASLTNDSQDAWIFQVPIRKSLIETEETDIYFGTLGCDNRLAFLLKKHGYFPINCPLDVKIYHLHQTQHRTYSKEKLPGPYLLLNVCRLATPGSLKSISDQDLQKYYQLFSTPRDHQALPNRRRPSALATMATGLVQKDLELLLRSLSRINLEIPIYILTDAQTEQKVKEIRSENKLKIFSKQSLDRYAGQTRDEMSQKGLWLPFMLEKCQVIDWALETVSDVLLLDSDIVLLDQLPLIPSDVQVALSPHYMDAKYVSNSGFFNAGFLWTNQKSFTTWWKDHVKDSTYYEQQILETVDKSFATYHLPINDNFGWWRALYCHPNRVSDLKLDNSGQLVCGSEKIRSIHTHWSGQMIPEMKQFNSILLKIIKTSPDHLLNELLL